MERNENTNDVAMHIDPVTDHFSFNILSPLMHVAPNSRIDWSHLRLSGNEC